MALNKVPYVDGTTVIYANNLNDIQDEIIANAADIDDLEGDVSSLDSGKVDKVNGKGLSTNDFTNTDKTALDNIKTTDTTLAVSGKAADAKTVGDNVMKWFSPPTSFGLADMPRYSYTFCDVSKFTDAPSNISGYVCITRTPFNVAGNISHVTLQIRDTPQNVYYSRFTEGATFPGWTKVATTANIPVIDAGLTHSGQAADAKAVGDALALKVDAVNGKGLSTNDFTDAEKTALDNIKTTDTTLSVSGKAADAKATGDHVMMWYNAPASPETFALSDMPRYSYTYVSASRFTNAPDGETGYASIVRRPYNSTGNMSIVTFQTRENLYYGVFVEGETFAGWSKVADQAGVETLVAGQIDDTLSVSGKAADAKVTGDTLATKADEGETSTKISDIDNAFGLVHVTWEQGNINSSGANSSSSTIIRTNYIPTTPGEQFIKYSRAGTNGGFTTYACRFYDENKTFLESNYSFIAPENAAFMRTTAGGSNASDGQKISIVRTPNNLTIDVGKRFVYGETAQSQILNIRTPAEAGARIFFMPIVWGGPEPSRITLYGESEGVYTELGYVSGLYDFITPTLDRSYSSFRATVTGDAPSESVALRVVFCVVGNDKISPVAYALGKKLNEASIAGLQEEVEELQETVDTMDESLLGATYNIFNKEDITLLSAYFGSDNVVKSSTGTRMLYMPIKPDTNYIYSYISGAYAKNIATSAIVPAVGDTLTAPTILTDSTGPGNGRQYRHFHTAEDAAYLAIYFYNSTHDSLTVDELLSGIMITEGTDFKMPYRAIEQGRVVTRDQMPVNPYGIFGIRFRKDYIIPRVERVYDAEGLTYRQQTADTVEYSDFDKAFPWSDMRECNVTVDGNGKKTIVYSGETGFSRSNNTFIEVPAFWFRRTVVKGIEEWCISGRPFSGADLEPWFLDSNGNPLKYRYIARYEGADGTNGISITGETPKTSVTRAAAKTLCETANYTLMDVYGYFALSHLMAIEYGTLDVQTYNIGISYLPYSMSTSGWNRPTNTATGNVAELSYSASDPRLTYLNVGDTIYLSPSGTQNTSNPRLITAIEFPSSTTVRITFSGDAYEISPSAAVFPAMQPTGRTDSMTYANGRPIANPMNSPFQYRGIENPYGNVWEFADNVTWTKSSGKFTIHSAETSFSAPDQQSTGNDDSTAGWIKTFGYDRDMPWATLPATVGSSLKNKYISDEWNNSTSSSQILVMSGGWDHQSLNGAFIARGLGSTTSNWLYGYRAMI